MLSSMMPVSHLGERSANGGLHLHGKFLKNKMMKKERVLALEAESRGTATEQDILQKHRIEVGQELSEVVT